MDARIHTKERNFNRPILGVICICTPSMVDIHHVVQEVQAVVSHRAITEKFAAAH